MNDCDKFVEKFNLPKGKCCTMCHESWKNISLVENDEVFVIDITIDKVNYLICCNQWKSYEEKILTCKNT